MLRVTDPQLENLMFLRDVTIPWMRENPKRVNLNILNSDCGIYGCVIGWYTMQRHGETVESRDSAEFRWEHREFGLAPWDEQRLFGMSRAGTLDDRARYLDELIAQRLVALEAR